MPALLIVVLCVAGVWFLLLWFGRKTVHDGNNVRTRNLVPLIFFREAEEDGPAVSILRGLCMGGPPAVCSAGLQNVKPTTRHHFSMGSFSSTNKI
jgi:hypothetical protein